MLISEMRDLKKGDQVRYTGNEGSNNSWPKNGTVITRCDSTWLDDDQSVKFAWGSGPYEYHFFSADELEFIKGELA